MITSEHLHLALNHLPFLGAAFAIIPLLIGLFKHQRTTVFAGLIIAIISGWATPFVMNTGESAYERYEEGPIASYLDPQAEEYLEVHEHRAEAWSKVMYASAVICSLGIIVLIWRPRVIVPVASLAALSCVASLGSGIWIAESGSTIRRPDFRSESLESNSANSFSDDEDKEHD
jgi:hypothetical protein